MSYEPATRNYDRVPFSQIRQTKRNSLDHDTLDEAYGKAHDILSAIYYNEWKLGNYANAFQSYKPNIGDTQSQAKALFDRLHALIATMHYLDFMLVARKRRLRDSERIRAEAQNTRQRPSGPSEDRFVIAQQRMASETQVGFTLTV